MAKIQDDDSSEFNDDSWSVDDDFDEVDITPDDFITVKCVRCRKLIFEDANQCPYCKHWQLSHEQTRHPLWLRVTAIICIAGMLGLIGIFIHWLYWL
jgi:DNA-directed RNA polymerase subunit RPC12/RpoP